MACIACLSTTAWLNHVFGVLLVPCAVLAAPVCDWLPHDLAALVLPADLPEAVWEHGVLSGALQACAQWPRGGCTAMGS